MSSSWRVGGCRLQSAALVVCGVAGLATAAAAGYYLFNRCLHSEGESGHGQRGSTLHKIVLRGTREGVATPYPVNPGLALCLGCETDPSTKSRTDLGLGLVSLLIEQHPELTADQTIHLPEVESVFSGTVLPWIFSPLYCGPVVFWTGISSCTALRSSHDTCQMSSCSWSKVVGTKRTTTKMRSVCMVRGADVRLWWAVSVDRARLTPAGLPYTVNKLMSITGVQRVAGQQTDTSSMEFSLVVGPDGKPRTTIRTTYKSQDFTRQRAQAQSPENQDQGQDQGQSQGQDQSQGQRQDQGQEQGQDQGQDQGQSQGQDQGQSQSQNQGQEQEQGQEQGQSQGQDQGQSQSQNQGQEQEQGQEQGQSQSQGQDQDQDQDQTSSESGSHDESRSSDEPSDLSAEEIQVPHLNSYFTSRGLDHLPVRLAALRQGFTMILAKPSQRDVLCTVGRSLLAMLAKAANKDEAVFDDRYSRLLAYCLDGANHASIAPELEANGIRYFNFIDVMYELVVLGMLEVDRRQPTVTVAGGFMSQLCGLLHAVLPSGTEETQGQASLAQLKEMLMALLDGVFTLPLRSYSSKNLLMAELRRQLGNHLQLMISSLH